VRSRTFVMILLAVAFGALAIFAGQKYLDREASRFRSVQVVQKPAAPTQTIVVAALPLRFANEVTRQHLREIAWPEDAVPKAPSPRSRRSSTGARAASPSPRSSRTSPSSKRRSPDPASAARCRP
jgi:Flp pilus assembly protein CpaB